MIVRRIREHVAHHNWFAVVIDLAIVVVGVFIGTQANNWNQARLDRDRGRQDRGMLIDDLRSNQANLEMRRRYYVWVRDEALKTLAAMGRPSAALGTNFVVDAYQASQILPWSLKRNTYDQIIAGNALAGIGDAQLRDQVSNYYVGADVTGVNITSVPPYRELVRSAMPYAAQVRIRGECGEKISEDSRGGAIMTLPQQCRLKLDPALVEKSVRQVHDAPRLELELNRLLVDLDQKLVSVGVISRRAGKLEQALMQQS